MTDPIIEGITNPEPANDDENSTNLEIDERRESLAILASLGTAKDYLGVQMSLGDVKRLSPKDVEKYFYRYQNIVGKQVTGGLVENAIKLASRLVSVSIPIDDGDALSNDLLQDEL